MYVSEDDPWDKLNAYIVYPTDDWKDLNIKFVLQTYRDYSKTKDNDYLETMYPVCKVNHCKMCVYQVQCSLTYPDTSVPSKTIHITEFPV